MTATQNNTISPTIIAYVPVVHRGYIDFFNSHPDVEQAYLFDTQQIQEFDYLRKEIRALTPQEARAALQAAGVTQTIELLTSDVIAEFKRDDTPLLIPTEDVVEAFVAQNLPDNPAETSGVFLRWDRNNVTQHTTVNVTVAKETEHAAFMHAAYEQAAHSSDWWRQVGAVIVKDGEVVAHGYNKHLPSQHTPYTDGDPRNTQKAGKNIELCTSIHAEAAAIAEAAKKGVSLDGAQMYATTYACPVCARLVAASGIQHFYFAEGYSSLDAAEIFTTFSVNTTQVVVEKPSHPSIDKQYPEKQ